MAAQLNLVAATVEADETFPDVQIIVRQGIATISKTGVAQRTKEGVTAVERAGAAQWVIRFSDSTTWSVARAPRRGGCGCG